VVWAGQTLLSPFDSFGTGTGAVKKAQTVDNAKIIRADKKAVKKKVN